MTDTPPTDADRPPSRVARLWRRGEASAGLTFAGIVAVAADVAVLLIGLAAADQFHSPGIGFTAVVLAAVGTLFDLLLLLDISKSRRPGELPPEFTARLRHACWASVPLVSRGDFGFGSSVRTVGRLLLSGWFLLHFAIGLAVAVGFGWFVDAHPASAYRDWIGYAGPLPGMLVVFGFCYASNLYLLLAVAVLTDSPSILRRVWSLRLVWDIAVTLAAGLLLSLK